MRRGLVLVLILCFLVPSILYGGAQAEGAAAEPAEPATLEMVGHRVHKKIVTEGGGGDIITPWIEQNAAVAAVNWNTLGIAEIHDRLFREAALPKTEVAVAYLLNTYALPRVANLLEPLDDHMKKNPIEGFEENFGAGQLGALTFDGKLYGVPIRSATHGMGYNQAIYDERGIAGPPTTPDELYEIAKKCTFTRADGTQVYGFIQQSHFYYTGVTSISRMWDGGFVSGDLTVTCNEKPMVNAITMLRNMYAEQIIPQNTPSIKHAEKQRMLQQCVIAQVFDVMGKIDSYNKDAVCPDLKVTDYPLDPSLKAKYEHGPASTEFWSMVIPKNSKYKEQAWDYIRTLSNHDASLKMALNGNGPARSSVFEDAGWAQNVPYAQVALRAAKNARVPIPAFDKTPQAMVLIDSYIEKAMFGEMAPQAAMDELAAKLKQLSSMLK